MIRLIRIRTTGLEAALARFDAWWRLRSPRERIMLAGLAIFLAALILVFGVIKPLQAARAQALADIRTYETLNARIRAAGTLSAAPVRQRPGAPLDAIRESARGQGLTATTEALPNGVRAAIAQGNYNAVMAWIADAGATTPLAATRVTLRRAAAPGTVSATVDFTR